MTWDTELGEQLRRNGEDRFFKLHYYETIDSTNEECKRRFREGADEGFLAVGEEQTAGKGRRGRTWISPKGEAAYFSFLLTPTFAPEFASSLTLVMGLSVAQAVREVTDLPVGIKWPNDVVINHKKICGILTEAMARDGKLDYVIPGTGVNVNNTQFAEDIADRATSLKIENGGQDVSRAEIVAAILACFRRNYEIYCKTADLSGLIDAYNELLVSRGIRVRIEDPKEPYIAVSHGIDERGGLIVEREDGTREVISTGEVSVRGLYGYI